MKQLLFMLTMLISLSIAGQCSQHVFSSVGATEWTDFEYQDCNGGDHYFGLPTGGYTVIFCADIGTAFALNGDGFVYPLLTEHPNYASCVQPVCQGDFDEDGVVGVSDLQVFLSNYGSCEN
tara:strand:+ start:309 stop:671 length:363 start_codon:yes stop_codon:yes gene_type:complete